MGLTMPGRGLVCSAYGVSKLLYCGEFVGVPPEATLTLIKRWSRHLVQHSVTPAASDSRPRRTTAVPQALMAGSPKLGGFGLLPMHDHIVARHAVWACKLMCSFLPGVPQPWWAQAACLVMSAKGLGVLPVIHFLALPGTTHNPPAQLPATAHGHVRTLLAGCGPVVNRLAAAFSALPRLQWAQPHPFNAAVPSAWCHALPLWHVPGMTVGPRHLPWHIAYPDLYSMQGRPETLGDLAWLCLSAQRAAPGLSAAQLSDRANRILLMHTMRTALPQSWVAAAEQHAQLVQGGAPSHAALAEVVRLLLSGCHFPPPPASTKHLSVAQLTVKTATCLLQRHVYDSRASMHKLFIASACGLVDPPQLSDHLIRFRSTLKFIWKLPVPNVYKEVLWKLAVDGVAGARARHPWLPLHRCGCGADGVSDMRLHHFWECPVAQAVVSAMRRELETGNFPLPVCLRQHLWLLRSPNTAACHKLVWSCVCLAALHAMDVGRRSITTAWLQHYDTVVNPDLGELDPVSDIGQRATPLPPPALSVVWQAHARAAAELALHHTLAVLAHTLARSQLNCFQSVPIDGPFLRHIPALVLRRNDGDEVDNVVIVHD